MFQILAKFGGGVNLTPPRDFGRKGPEWPQMAQMDGKQVILTNEIV